MSIQFQNKPTSQFQWRPRITPHPVDAQSLSVGPSHKITFQGTHVLHVIALHSAHIHIAIYKPILARFYKRVICLHMAIDLSNSESTHLTMTDANKYYKATLPSSFGRRAKFNFYCDTDAKLYRGTYTEGDSSSGNDSYFPIPAGNAVQLELYPGESVFFSCASASKKIRTVYAC